MAEKIATRAAYGKALVELADQEPNLVVLDADLSGSTMTKEFAAAHPDRFFDMGIAEANMVGVAAGLATCGKPEGGFSQLTPKSKDFLDRYLRMEKELRMEGERLYKKYFTGEEETES